MNRSKKPLFLSPFCEWGFDWGYFSLLFWSYNHVNTIWWESRFIIKEGHIPNYFEDHPRHSYHENLRCHFFWRAIQPAHPCPYENLLFRAFFQEGGGLGCVGTLRFSWSVFLQQQPNRNETVDPKQVKIKKVKYESNWIRTFLFWHEIKDIQFNSITVAVFGHPYSSFWLPLKWYMDLLGSPNGFNHPPRKKKKNTHTCTSPVGRKTPFPVPQFFAGWTCFAWTKQHLCAKKHRLLPFGGKKNCPSSHQGVTQRRDPVENSGYLFDQGDPCNSLES